jgi:hypothetical protein
MSWGLFFFEIEFSYLTIFSRSTPSVKNQNFQKDQED